ncbi:hypothetical protein P879_09373 [Paragonimus westermani]|uniref:Reverse transcriptase domain-containing protein n=1 Tax=Paragonimus westermani TaxID=34504 RepID=A0A8T0DBZ5_9TREM|nr:hypothetical protein P879_09373 [Paragonimus westermani]
MLVLESPTSQLSLARLTFVPKVEESVTPADYRPIAVSSVLQRVLHKILDKRVRDTIKFSSLQVAFQKKDGCLEASTLLHTMLRTVHDEAKPISVTFLDVSKAFHSVSHDTILLWARKHGLPPPLVPYLSRLYSESLSNHMGWCECEMPTGRATGRSTISRVIHNDYGLSSKLCSARGGIHSERPM